MTGNGDIGIHYLHYQVESALATRSQVRHGGGRQEGLVSPRPFMLSSGRHDGGGVSARRAPVPTQGQSELVDRSRQGGDQYSSVVPGAGYKRACYSQVHLVYGQTRSAHDSVSRLPGGMSRTPNKGCVQQSYNPVPSVFVHINSRTGSVRLRDYTRRLSEGIVYALKRWAKVFRRNGRLES